MLVQLPGGTAIEPDGEIVNADDNGEIKLHTAQALSRLIEFWRGKPNLAGWLSDYIDEIQELENVVWDVIVGRLPDYAEGVQLDVLGAIVGERRNGLGDAAFRVRIKARIRINQSFGTPKDVIEVLQLIDPAPFHVVEYGIAAFTVYYDTPPANDAVASQIHGIVKETRAAGVGATVRIPTSATRGARYGYAFSGTNAHIGFGYAASGTFGGLYSAGFTA